MASYIEQDKGDKMQEIETKIEVVNTLGTPILGDLYVSGNGVLIQEYIIPYEDEYGNSSNETVHVEVAKLVPYK